MKNSCIKKLSNVRIAIEREDYLAITGDKAAGLLLSFFEYWHNIKLEQSLKAKTQNDVAEKHGDDRSQDESLYQFHTAEDLQHALLGLVGRPAVKKGVKILKDLGFISIHKNPNPKYKFDNTKHFLLHPRQVNLFLEDLSDWISKPENSNKQILSYRNTESVRRYCINCQTGDQNLSDGHTGSDRTIPVTTSISTSIELSLSNAREEEIKTDQSKQDAAETTEVVSNGFPSNFEFDWQVASAFHKKYLQHNISLIQGMKERTGYKPEEKVHDKVDEYWANQAKNECWINLQVPEDPGKLHGWLGKNNAGLELWLKREKKFYPNKQKKQGNGRSQQVRGEEQVTYSLPNLTKAGSKPINLLNSRANG